MKNVIIVESPSKSKTIESYMGSDYKVVSSLGHIRDLATSGKDGLGIDIEHNFKPDYTIIKGKTKLVSELKKICKGAKVYLATDPDREGEAISYHLKEVLGLSDDEYERVVFHEITKPAIKEAFKEPRKIDYNLVSSQETRRMLDRIIGFKLSKLLQKKIKSKSAGRVQSVALKLICDLETEIESFISTPYYELEALFENFKLDLQSYKGNKERILTRELANEIKDSLLKEFTVSNVEAKIQSRQSKPAYTTSTLQQDASNKLNYNSTKTMRIAQSLYEGKEIGNEHIGLITYMRTDSTRLSDVFVKEANEFINDSFGSDYVGTTHIKEQKLAQDAHEAIRVTSIYRRPEDVKDYLSLEEYKLYDLIYKRTLASLMSNAKFSRKTVLFRNNETVWKTTGQTLLFDGYLKVYGKEEDDLNKTLLNFKEAEKYEANDVLINELFTKPKTRYTESSLIKDMDELGIGRPSTYAQTMQVLKEREYVTLDKKYLVPTEQGRLTSKALDSYFSPIINVKYTAQMEEDLDKISKGEEDSLTELHEFYDEFMPLYDNAIKNMEATKPVLTDEICPECGAHLAVRKSKYGEFLACSNYPKCKYIKQDESIDLSQDNVDTGVTCPKCKKEHLISHVVKVGPNKGSLYYACNNYPKCKTTFSDIPTLNTCPKCGEMMLKDKDGNLYCSKHCENQTNITCPVCNKGHIVKRIATRGKNKGNVFFACGNFPKCKTIFNDEPLAEKCPICGSNLFKDKDGNKYCLNKECGYKE